MMYRRFWMWVFDFIPLHRFGLGKYAPWVFAQAIGATDYREVTDAETETQRRN